MRRARRDARGRLHSAQPVGDSGLAWAGSPPPRCQRADLASPHSPLQRSEPPFAARRWLARLSPSASLCPSPLSLSLPSLAFLGPSISLPARRSPVEVSRPPSVSGVSVALIVSAASLSSPDLRPWLAVFPALTLSLLSFVSVSAHLGLPATSPLRLPPYLCVSVSHGSYRSFSLSPRLWSSS